MTIIYSTMNRKILSVNSISMFVCLFLSFDHTNFLFWAAAPKGLVTYAFTHIVNFLLLLLPLLLLLTPPHTSGLISQSHGPYPSLEAQIPQGWDLGLEDGILALR